MSATAKTGGLNMDVLRFLPDDGFHGTLVARVWRPGDLPGPSVAAIRSDGVYDLSAAFPTMSTLLESDAPARLVQEASGERIGSLEEILSNSDEATRDPGRAFFLAPCDLQVVKACGVTFATSMIERLIEEQAGGDAARAQEVRAKVKAQAGADLSSVKPGSPQAQALKQVLQSQGIWSQYLAATLAFVPTPPGTTPGQRLYWP